ncbi:hypothetical protein N2152v2_006519 [Parachlorella kessleri]
MTAAGTDLVLDRDVRDWVLIPLTFSVILMMLLRQYATQFFSSGKPSTPPTPEELKGKNAVARSVLLRSNGAYIPESGYRQRRTFFTAKDTGVFNQKVESKNMQEQMITNPDMMQNMMKAQMGGLVPQIGMGAFVNFFFSGFILGKVPFALSPKFRMMLQRGIDLPSLDVSYFTSLSYYILLLFGLRGVMMLVFRDDAINDAEMMQRQMQAMQGGGMGPMGFEADKAFAAEKQALDLVDHRWKLAGSEARAAAILRSQLGYSR